MKKLLIFGVAAISFAACVQEQVVETPQGNPIAFADAFIDNATRAAVDPSTTVDDLTGFDVWGFVKEYDGTVFADQDVTLQGSGWTYQGTQFWAPEQPYYFAALAPMNSANVKETLATGESAKLGLGTVEFTNVDGSEDLLYAACKVTSKKIGQANDPVKFQFKHLLSKVKFTFKNGFLTDNAYVEVKNVKMTAPAAASIDLAQENYSKAWNLGAEKVTLAFGDVQKLSYLLDGEAAAERLTIPASSSHSYTVTFDLVLYMGNQPVYETSKTSTVTGVELEMGKAYNFAAEINPDNLELDSIQFDVVEIDEWTPAGTSDLLVDAYAADGTELKEAVALGGNIQLTDDVNLAKLDLTTATEDVVINAAGHKINTTDSYGIQVTAGKNVTIKNAEVVITKEGNYMAYAAGFKIENGDYAGSVIDLENCTIKMANTDWAYAVNMPASVKNLTLNIRKCTLEGAIAVQCWGDGNTINITDSKLICNYTTNATYCCYCVALQGDGSNISENNTLNISNCEFLYNGVNAYDQPIYNYKDYGINNTVTINNCTLGAGVTENN